MQKGLLTAQGEILYARGWERNGQKTTAEGRKGPGQVKFLHLLGNGAMSPDEERNITREQRTSMTPLLVSGKEKSGKQRPRKALNGIS